MPCRSCGSGQQHQYRSEIAIHHKPSLSTLRRPILVFPTVQLCITCGFVEFTIPAEELKEFVASTGKAASR
jgi:hypothetical protein